MSSSDPNAQISTEVTSNISGYVSSLNINNFSLSGVTSTSSPVSVTYSFYAVTPSALMSSQALSSELNSIYSASDLKLMLSSMSPYEFLGTLTEANTLAQPGVFTAASAPSFNTPVLPGQIVIAVASISGATSAEVSASLSITTTPSAGNNSLNQILASLLGGSVPGTSQVSVSTSSGATAVATITNNSNGTETISYNANGNNANGPVSTSGNLVLSSLGTSGGENVNVVTGTNTSATANSTATTNVAVVVTSNSNSVVGVNGNISTTVVSNPAPTPSVQQVVAPSVPTHSIGTPPAPPTIATTFMPPPPPSNVILTAASWSFDTAASMPQQTVPGPFTQGNDVAPMAGKALSTFTVTAALEDVTFKIRNQSCSRGEGQVLLNIVPVPNPQNLAYAIHTIYKDREGSCWDVYENNYVSGTADQHGDTLTLPAGNYQIQVIPQYSCAADFTRCQINWSASSTGTSSNSSPVSFSANQVPPATTAVAVDLSVANDFNVDVNGYAF